MGRPLRFSTGCVKLHLLKLGVNPATIKRLTADSGSIMTDFSMLRKKGAGWRLAVAVVLAALSTGFSPSSVEAKGPVPATEVSTMSVASLPEQGRHMVRLIYQGGPFRYDKDGSVFGNRERILPAKNRGYYREYTVRTPSEPSRAPDASFVVVLYPPRPMPVITPMITMRVFAESLNKIQR